MRDLLQFHPDATRWDFELLNVGRHVRFDEATKVVLGRCADDNAMLATFATRPDAPETVLLRPEDFRGPDALVAGRPGESAVAFAAGLMLRWARPEDLAEGQVHVQGSDHTATTRVSRHEPARSAGTL